MVHTGKSGKRTFNFETCFYTFSQPRTYKLSGGTGKDKAISGHGTYTASGIGLSPKLSQTRAAMAADQGGYVV
jgi:hypothetical protein